MIIVSVPDRVVRDPSTRRVVDDAGIDINPTDPYWARLLADGDVAEASGALIARIDAAAKPAAADTPPASQEKTA